MTRTTQVEWHPNRPLIHFGSPSDVTYWRPEIVEKPKKRKKSGKKSK